jgi:hypothetical protein
MHVVVPCAYTFPFSSTILPSAVAARLASTTSAGSYDTFRSINDYSPAENIRLNQTQYFSVFETGKHERDHGI